MALCWLGRLNFIDDLHRGFGVFDEPEDVFRPVGDVVDVPIAFRHHQIAIRRKIDEIQRAGSDDTSSR